MTPPRTSRRAWLILLAVALVWLVVARPWTIRPIAGDPVGPLDATAFVAEIWETRVKPEIEMNAVDLRRFLDAAPAGSGAVRVGAVAVQGVVIDVDTSSRLGVALVDVEPADGRADVHVQIGPVLRGTALRDSLPFIRFTDFTNQVEFAAVASALNDRVLSTVIARIDVGALAGRRVRVVGAASVSSSDAAAPPSIVPVEIVVEERP